MQPPPRQPAPVAARERWILLAILLLGAGIRAAYIVERSQDPTWEHPAFDAAYHDYWAWGLVSGDWSRPQGLADPKILETPYLRPPAYPYLLAAVYAVAGHRPWAPRVVQASMGLLAVWLAYRLGRRVFGAAVGLLWAAGVALHWAVVFFEGELLAPPLEVLCLLGVLLALEGAAGGLSLPRAAASGAALGLFAVTRPNALAFLPVAAAWLAWVGRRRGARAVGPAAALVGACLAVLVPVALRNYRVSGEVFLVTANAGINFYIGNHPQADGATPAIPDLPELTGRTGWTCFDYPEVVRALGTAVGRPLTYGEAERYWIGRALAFIREHPERFLELTLKRAALFWGPAEVGNNRDLHFARLESRVLRWLPYPFPVLLALALVGLVWAVRDVRRGQAPAGEGACAHPRAQAERLWLFAGFASSYFASFLPFFVAARYRIPVVVVLLGFAAYAVARVLRLLRERAWWPLIGTVVAAGALGAAASVNWAGYAPRPEQWHLTRGAAYSEAGAWSLAAQEYERALRWAPRDPVAHNNLALALLKLGRHEEAVEHWRLALRANPQDPNAHFNVGALLLRLGRPAEAAAHYEAGLRGRPEDPHALANYGAALLEMGRAAEALAPLERSAALEPRLAQAHLHRGRALLQLGRPAEALDALQRAAELEPKNPWTHLALGATHEALGDAARARAHYERALVLRPEWEAARDALERLVAPRGSE